MLITRDRIIVIDERRIVADAARAARPGSGDIDRRFTDLEANAGL
ncbi:hypothetical protein [Sphingomonas qomolangmaensis]|uniref:Uncharacterized protein n=1 Tax=Sphingomonas qomolangmaensis TaxID=2918765 RepID=A0ABY5LDY9_9SPHN|nr:hypothetical protein [Sphingomonas qomolangmaensis]UUL84004.1 hypothetical protein NMP03_07405 [Sphingomonas qomolangmaensis]